MAIDILRFCLLLISVAAWFAGAWVGLLSLQKTGRRYWLINPMAQLDSLFTKETGIFLICIFVAVGSMFLRDTLT